MNKPTEKQRKTIHAEQMHLRTRGRKSRSKNNAKQYHKIADITDRSVLISRTKNYAKQYNKIAGITDRSMRIS